MDSEKKNPSQWKEWILILLMVTQILTIAYFRQENQELWNAVVQQSQELVQQKQELVQLGQRLIEHQQNDILHKTSLNRLLENWIQNPTCSK